MPDRRFFVTPTRLTKNPFLWRSVGLMGTLKPGQEFFLSEATIRWLRGGQWALISPENAALCIELADYNMEYDWRANIPAAEKVLDLVLASKAKDKWKIPLSSPQLREESLTTFLEKTYTDSIITFEKARLLPHTGWSNIPEMMNISNWVNYLLANTSLKTYQLEYMWKVTPKNFELGKNLIARIPLDTVPDYMFRELLDNHVSFEDRYGYSNSNIYVLLKEGIRRGMLSRTEIYGTIVPPMARPTTFVKPAVTEVVTV